jgi:hypothetical protein
MIPMTYTIQPGQRCDWWRVLEDLRMHGLSLEAIADATGIPKSTILGYKNLAAEPKHADGDRLIGLWRARMMPPVPVVPGTTRSRRVDA